MAAALSAAESTSFPHASIDGISNRPPPARRGHFPSFRPLVNSRSRHKLAFRRRRIQFFASASASGSRGNSLDDLVASLAKAFESAWLQTVNFVESQNFQGKIKHGFSAANQKIDELSYDARKGVQEFDRQFRVSERAQEMTEFAGQQVRNVDQQLGLVQKFRNASSNFRRNWPRYRRQLEQFLQTPIGRMLTTFAFMWFLLSGWLFRIILLSMWVLPLAAPLLISSAARNMIVEGQCPACKRRFIGNRNQMVVCNYCKAIVWQPRQDFSRGQSDPTIIDIDVD